MLSKCRFLKIFTVAAFITAFAIFAGGCGDRMVTVPDGRGGEMLAPLYKNLPVANFSSDDFSNDGEYVNYKGDDYIGLRGIDVSEHQLEIDWNAVKSDGVEFAVIRAGYRGYSEGKLYVDKYFRQNMDGAKNAGIKVGVYFFSQATTVDEAIEEANYLIESLEGFKLDLPVFFDWEPIYEEGSRTQDMNDTTLTDCCIAFSNVIRNAGYEPGVYFYRSLGYHDYELDRLSDITFWAAAPGEYSDFYYAHTFWQYSYDAIISGIDGETDLDIMFVPKEQG